MANVEQELAALENGLSSLSSLQEQIDAATWLIKDPLIAKVRHINLHLIRLCGKLSDMCHKWEHDVAENKTSPDTTEHLDPETMQRIIADFIIHATQLNNVLGDDLFKIYKQQVGRNLERYAPDSNLNLALRNK